MPEIAIQGGNVVAHAAAHFCQRAGLNCQLTAEIDQRPDVDAVILGSNITRLLRAIDPQRFEALGHQPSREQVRLAKSAYLLSELPLGKFHLDRYGAPLVNVSYQELLDFVRTDSSPVGAKISVDHTPALTVETTPPTRLAADETLGVWYASQPGTSVANVTWLSDTFIGRQFSTESNTHFIYVGMRPAEDAQCHPSLKPFLQALKFIRPLTYESSQTAMYSGRTAYLGGAFSNSFPLQLPTFQTGIEDAWVLSRMLENYDDDIVLALSEFERFRLPRHQKIAAANKMAVHHLLGKKGSTAVARNLGIAFRARFLPEMAMQQVDWYYQYDCIRGFR